MFLLLGIITFLLLVPCRRETFQLLNDNTPVTSRSLYRTSTNFDKDVSGLATVLADREDFLQMTACYQFDPAVDPRTYFPKCYISSFGVYTNSFEEIRAKIISTLKTIAERASTKPLQGNIYILIQQSPYMRDDAGNVIAVQYNISSYDFNPKVGKDASGQPLYVRAYIILEKYTSDLRLSTSPSNVVMTLLPLKTNKDQCFLKCVNDNTSSYCGCLNLTPVSNASQSYTAACSSTPDRIGNTDTNVNVPADFAILYRINPFAKVMVENSIVP